MWTRERHTKRKGFTLIELLVVIAIIALLVSILIPSLTKAKNLAKQVVCQTNLHDVYMGHSFYAEDNNDWQVPVAAVPANGSLDEYVKHRWYWYLTYHEYLPAGPGPYGNRTSLVVKCPLFDELVNQRNCYYGRNYYNGIASFKLEDIINPADKVMVADSYDDWESGIGASYIRFDSEPYWYWDSLYGLHGRHVNDRACIVYMDGHIGALSRDEKEHGLLDLDSWQIPKGLDYGGNPKDDTQFLIDLGL
jgi:prepilin-type N-terminal cleavage/methylation domain-containing protein